MRFSLSNRRSSRQSMFSSTTLRRHWVVCISVCVWRGGEGAGITKNPYSGK